MEGGSRKLEAGARRLRTIGLMRRRRGACHGRRRASEACAKVVGTRCT
jgi:hypothetical protein